MPKQILSYSTLEHAGRLGNQLWQIASTVGMAVDRGMQPLFPAEWSYRQFFSCPDEWFGVCQPGDADARQLATRLDRRCRPYLQDLSLWRNHTAQIGAAFQPSMVSSDLVEWEWLETFSSLPHPICAVHIRRGDYVTNPIGTVTSLPLDYYRLALDKLSPASVVVFSDDINWCRENFLEGDLYYNGIPRTVEQDPTYMTNPVFDWVDLFLQAECEQHIISNSTFSWWGAWLSDDESPIYPSRWYGRDLAAYIDFRAMIPPSWTQMKVYDV